MIVAFCAAFAVLAWNAFENTDQGLPISSIALKGTYQKDYAELQETFYGTYSQSLVTVNRKVPQT